MTGRRNQLFGPDVQFRASVKGSRESEAFYAANVREVYTLKALAAQEGAEPYLVELTALVEAHGLKIFTSVEGVAEDLIAVAGKAGGDVDFGDRAVREGSGRQVLHRRRQGHLAYAGAALEGRGEDADGPLLYLHVAFKVGIDSYQGLARVIASVFIVIVADEAGDGLEHGLGIGQTEIHAALAYLEIIQHGAILRFVPAEQIARDAGHGIGNGHAIKGADGVRGQGAAVRRIGVRQDIRDRIIIATVCDGLRDHEIIAVGACRPDANDGDLRRAVFIIGIDLEQSSAAAVVVPEHVIEAAGREDRATEESKAKSQHKDHAQGGPWFGNHRFIEPPSLNHQRQYRHR